MKYPNVLPETCTTPSSTRKTWSGSWLISPPRRKISKLLRVDPSNRGVSAPCAGGPPSAPMAIVAAASVKTNKGMYRFIFAHDCITTAELPRQDHPVPLQHQFGR